MDFVALLTGLRDPDAVVAAELSADHSQNRLAVAVAVVAPDLVAVWQFVARVYLTCLVATVAVLVLPSCHAAVVADLAAFGFVPAGLVSPTWPSGLVCPVSPVVPQPENRFRAAERAPWCE
jgi:hypothetical protein